MANYKEHNMNNYIAKATFVLLTVCTAAMAATAGVKVSTVLALAGVVLR